MKRAVEYIWVDGSKPTARLRSKTKIIGGEVVPLAVNLPEWQFDGSSTSQAEGASSDCILKPVRAYKDPIRGEGSILLMCEVYGADKKPHSTNTRALLREVLSNGADKEKAWFGF